MLELPHNMYKLMIKRQKHIIELLMHFYFSFEIPPLNNVLIKPPFSYLYKQKFFQFILSKRIIRIIILTNNLNDALSIHHSRYNLIWIFHGIRTNR